MTRFYIAMIAGAMGALSAYAGEVLTFEAVDTNMDGLITESEFVSWTAMGGETSLDDAIADFALIEVDSSGMLTVEEFDTAFADAAEDDVSTDESETTEETSQ